MSNDKMREEFEAWAEPKGYNIAKEAEIYYSLSTDEVWDAWQASRAAMGAEVAELPEPEELAASFHEIYERLAPSFCYETRKETKDFDAATPNGQLMIYTCREILALLKKVG